MILNGNLGKHVAYIKVILILGPKETSRERSSSKTAQNHCLILNHDRNNFNVVHGSPPSSFSTKKGNQYLLEGSQRNENLCDRRYR